MKSNKVKLSEVGDGQQFRRYKNGPAWKIYTMHMSGDYIIYEEGSKNTPEGWDWMSGDTEVEIIEPDEEQKEKEFQIRNQQWKKDKEEEFKSIYTRYAHLEGDELTQKMKEMMCDTPMSDMEGKDMNNPTHTFQIWDVSEEQVINDIKVSQLCQSEDWVSDNPRHINPNVHSDAGKEAINDEIKKWTEQQMNDKIDEWHNSEISQPLHEYWDGQQGSTRDG